MSTRDPLVNPKAGDVVRCNGRLIDVFFVGTTAEFMKQAKGDVIEEDGVHYVICKVREHCRVATQQLTLAVWREQCIEKKVVAVTVAGA